MSAIQGTKGRRAPSGKWVDRQTACQVINEAAGGIKVFDPQGLHRERYRAPAPQFIGGQARYSREECEAFGKRIREERAARRLDGGKTDAA